MYNMSTVIPLIRTDMAIPYKDINSNIPGVIGNGTGRNGAAIHQLLGLINNSVDHLKPFFIVSYKPQPFQSPSSAIRTCSIYVCELEFSFGITYTISISQYDKKKTTMIVKWKRANWRCGNDYSIYTIWSCVYLRRIVIACVGITDICYVMKVRWSVIVNLHIGRMVLLVIPDSWCGKGCGIQ